ncbi:MAG: CDP-diacylglycerol--serine O-phosphatidyltransferase [Deltaproteobacteria bacterium]|nr:CDP-diacylglycerol--serine O-phosphatidyltransferase [Deltaproteobacteria bacterium]
MEKKKLSRIEIKERLYRRRYLVPNAVTVGSLFCGFLAIIYASSERWEKAAFAILLAILLDGLDGRVARRLNATSPFGLEFDSLSDLVSFGIAPAFLMYEWSFRQLADEFGVFVCFLYALCAASRLARFNITTTNLSSFEGLPSPAAASIVAAVVYFMSSNQPDFAAVIMSAALMAVIAYLMVCTIPYPSIKKMKVTNIRLTARLVIGVMMGLVWWRPKVGLLVLAAGYALSGPVLEALKERRKRKLTKDPSNLKLTAVK